MNNDPIEESFKAENPFIGTWEAVEPASPPYMLAEMIMIDVFDENMVVKTYSAHDVTTDPSVPVYPKPDIVSVGTYSFTDTKLVITRDGLSSEYAYDNKNHTFKKWTAVSRKTSLKTVYP